MSNYTIFVLKQTTLKLILRQFVYVEHNKNIFRYTEYDGRWRKKK